MVLSSFTYIGLGAEDPCAEACDGPLVTKQLRNSFAFCSYMHDMYDSGCQSVNSSAVIRLWLFKLNLLY